MAEKQTKISKTPPPKGRLYWGGGIFLFGFVCPLFVPLVTASALPMGWKAAVSGLLVIGMPEIFMLIAVAVLGKAGFHYLKEQLFALLKQYAPPDKVNPTRYRIGLVMFVLPLLMGWLLPYLGQHIPGYRQSRLAFNIAGDLILVISFFVLGGDFWDKLRALFVHDAKARFPPSRAAQTPPD